MDKKDSDNNINILVTIYDDVFKHLRNGMTDVFLCGGVSSKYEITTRDKLKRELETFGDIRILYPEELLMDLFNSNKNHNLLALEGLLANNCDYICIVCESVGSFVELGAFTNNTETFDKVLALVQAKYKNQNSFLMLGPIKYIQSKNKDNVLFYNSNISEIAKMLKSKLRSKKYANSNKDVNTIIGMHYFILLMIFFFKEIEVKTSVDLIKQLLLVKKFEIDSFEFNLLFKPAMKLLYKERFVERININKKYYRITNKGRQAKNNMFILKMDLRDFFPSIGRDNIYYIFKQVGYNSTVANILTNICTINEILPQGAVTSPYISNLVCRNLDKRISKYCNKREIIYTRYADDLTFSSNDKGLLKSIYNMIKKIIEDEGFKLNFDKTCLLTPKGKKTITGITVNNGLIKAPKSMKRDVRAMIHKAIVKGDYSDSSKIKGYISYISSIEEDYIEKIKKYINSFSDKYVCMFQESTKAFNTNKFFDDLVTFKIKKDCDFISFEVAKDYEQSNYSERQKFINNHK